jgi:putative hydrolase of the HAD superfamily
MSLSGVKNLLFDLGGVIITLDRDAAVRRFIELGAKDAEEQLNAYHQNGIFLHLEDGSLTHDAFCDAFRAEFGVAVSNEAIDSGWLAFMGEVPAYKLKMLEDLKAQGYKLYLLSNTNPVIHRWALSPEWSTEGKPLSAYFDKLYLSYCLKLVKPSAAIFHHVIADAGLTPSETLFIDDGVVNIEMAASLGFQTYQPLNGEDFRHLFL